MRKNLAQSGRCKVFTGDMFSALLGEKPYDLILFNPPQTGGPVEFEHRRLDKWGGLDGSKYFIRMARECGPLIHSASVLAVSHIGIANPLRVRKAMQKSGGMNFTISTAAW